MSYIANSKRCFSSFLLLVACFLMPGCDEEKVSGPKEAPDKTVAELEQAAAQGHLLAKHNLGVAYRDGKGVPKDLQKATEWFQKAADQGYRPAIKALELMKLETETETETDKDGKG